MKKRQRPVEEQLVCKTQPLCKCLGVAKDAKARFECNCLRDVTGRRCMVCCSALVTIAEYEAAS